MIEELSTRLVQEAPARDAAVVAQLVEELRVVGSPLALAIARIVEYVDEGLVDASIALPALAEACATCAAGVRGQADARALEAARYRVDTLTPMPASPFGVPDVPTYEINLARRRRT